MNTTSVMLGVGVVFAVLFLAGLLRSAPDPEAVLKAQYFELSRLSPTEAPVDLADRVDALSRRFPGHTYLWYLDWLVKDLKRAKR